MRLGNEFIDNTHIRDKHSESLKAKGNNIKKLLVKVLIIILAIPYAFLVVLAFFSFVTPNTSALQRTIDLIISISPFIIIYIGHKFSKNNSE